MTLLIFIGFRNKKILRTRLQHKNKKLKSFFVVFNVLYARSSLDFSFKCGWCEGFYGYCNIQTIKTDVLITV